jgi:hypothetical protein
MICGTRSRTLDRDEAWNALKALNFFVTNQEFESIFTQRDKDKNGLLDWEVRSCVTCLNVSVSHTCVLHFHRIQEYLTRRHDQEFKALSVRASHVKSIIDYIPLREVTRLSAAGMHLCLSCPWNIV